VTHIGQCATAPMRSADPLEHWAVAHPRHPQIEQHQVRPLAHHRVEVLTAAGDRFNLRVSV
jgi:hypothetical protein